MNDLLERYLQAIGRYLPEAQREDTVAELRANLWEQMDARVEECGRPLDANEVAAILKEHGKPEAVALRYLPQRSLIGPAIYPFYLFALRRALPVWLVLYALTILGTSGGGSVAEALARFAFGFPVSALAFLAAITIVFAAINWANETGRLGTKLSEWDPMKMPEVNPEGEVESARSLWKRVIDLGAHCLWFAFVLWVPRHPFWVMGPGVFFLRSLHVDWAPVWHVFYVLLIGVLTVQLGIRVAAFLPGSKRWATAMDLGTKLLGLLAIGYLCVVPVYFVAGAGADATQIVVVNHLVSLAMRIAFFFALIGFVKDIWGFAKRTGPVKQLAF